NRPSNILIRAAYLAYLNVVGGLLGWILHRDADTYRYIPASIRNYPGAGGVARMFEDRGFVDVRCHACLGGLMTIHIARKPGQPAWRAAPMSTPLSGREKAPSRNCSSTS